jgi:transposase-like protein
MHQCQRERQRYYCNACDSEFNDLTNTVFAHHHQRELSVNLNNNRELNSRFGEVMLSTLFNLFCQQD